MVDTSSNDQIMVANICITHTTMGVVRTCAINHAYTGHVSFIPTSGPGLILRCPFLFIPISHQSQVCRRTKWEI